MSLSPAIDEDVGAIYFKPRPLAMREIFFHCKLIMLCFIIHRMERMIKAVFSLLFIACFSLVPALHYSEQEYRDISSSSTGDTWISNVRDLHGESAPFKDTLRERGPQSALTFLAKRSVSHTHTNAKNSRLLLSTSSVIAVDLPVSITVCSITQQFISHPHTEFCLFASDISPPFYSLRLA